MQERLSQCDMVIKYINDFGSITTLQAFHDLGITRLASRIHDLKKRGYCFARETMESQNRYGQPVRYIRYSFLTIDRAEE